LTIAKGTEMNRAFSTLILSVGLVSALAVAGCGKSDPAGGPGATGGTPGGSGGKAGSGGTGAGGSGGGSGGTVANAGGSGGTGTDTAPPGDTGTPVGGDYFPFAVGNVWEYEVLQAGQATERKVQTIVRMEAVGAGPDKDKVVFRVESRRPDGIGDATISWQAREGSKVVRYREQACSAGSVILANGTVDKCTVTEEDTWSPARIRIDEMPKGMPYAKDLSWDETYTETKTTINLVRTPPMTTTNEVHTSKWTVIDVGTTVGTYKDCVVLRKTSMQDVAKTYTFCKGVGKVKEEGAGQTENLVKFTLK
jgi:hypothetical protein